MNLIAAVDSGFRHMFVKSTGVRKKMYPIFIRQKKKMKKCVLQYVVEAIRKSTETGARKHENCARINTGRSSDELAYAETFFVVLLHTKISRN